jgi:putative FmdB family regulatory protein
MSKLIMYDFHCPTHGLFEDMVQPDKFSAPCPKCSRNARRQISAVRIDMSAMATSPSASPESIRHFDRVHRQRREIEDRNYERHQDYGAPAGAD